jgi:hypothetical protein
VFSFKPRSQEQIQVATYAFIRPYSKINTFIAEILTILKFEPTTYLLRTPVLAHLGINQLNNRCSHFAWLGCLLSSLTGFHMRLAMTVTTLTCVACQLP